MSKKPKQKSRTKREQPRGRQVIQGITLSSKNEATVAPELADGLFDLALKLEETTGLAVDVQHVLAAIVMGSTTGEIPNDETVSSLSTTRLKILEKHVRIVFSQFGGKVGEDD